MKSERNSLTPQQISLPISNKFSILSGTFVEFKKPIKSAAILCVFQPSVFLSPLVTEINRIIQEEEKFPALGKIEKIS